MNTPRMYLPDEAGRAVAQHVATHGRGVHGVESGGFLLTPLGSTTVDIVAIAGVVGITRRRDQFHISGAAVDMLSEWADANDHRIAAQFHSHGTTAFLSPIDRSAGYRVAGFVTTVVPAFANPPSDATQWGWWRFSNHDWHPTNAPATADGPLELTTFDEDGVS